MTNRAGSAHEFVICDLSSVIVFVRTFLPTLEDAGIAPLKQFYYSYAA
jgi:hypothetical protein